MRKGERDKPQSLKPNNILKSFWKRFGGVLIRNLRESNKNGDILNLKHL